ncbi:MAG: DNA alkylation repair protein [Butyricicoccus sp.]
MPESTIVSQLFALQDTAYRDFHARLMPTVPPERIIGVRIPQLRTFAKQLAKTPAAEEFLSELPHTYYEENNLHAYLIEAQKDFSRAAELCDAFLPYVDNWATCDTMSPKVFRTHTDDLLPYIFRWLKSDHPYTVRFALGMLMQHYLDDHFSPDYPELAAAVRSEEYYVKMMVAWYFATALAKQYPAVIPYFQQRRLPQWTHNKAIQKAVESRRIAPETKQYLKTLRWK